jgi:aldose 1-epimerase
MADLIVLSAGDAECQLCPELGGSIVGWKVGAQEILRRADSRAIASGDPLSMASFPLVPYSNRIGFGRFEWAGEQIRIEPNFPPEPHAIHGVGWKVGWDVAEQSDHHCALTYAHVPDNNWRWPFVATQRYALFDNMLEINVEARNLHSEAVPLAFGHHPYFDSVGAKLQFHADSVYIPDAGALPAHAETPSGIFDFSQGPNVKDRDIDHCYSGWQGQAVIHWQERALDLRLSSAMAAAVVYIPKNGDAFCFEPVPHINNALNRPHDQPAMPVVQPGDSYRATISMEVVPANVASL